MKNKFPSWAALALLPALACATSAWAQTPAASAPEAAVDPNAIQPGQTYRWGNGSYVSNKGNCRFEIGGRDWGPRSFFAPTPPGVHRANSRQNYHAECTAGGPIRLILTDREK
jgi:hypothetical protein